MKKLIEYHESKLKYYNDMYLENETRLVDGKGSIGNMEYYYDVKRKSLLGIKKHQEFLDMLRSVNDV